MEIIVAENKVIKESPKTVIPGVNRSISKRLTGILACIALKSKIRTRGNQRPNPILIGSRKISFVFLFARLSILILSPPLRS